MRVLFWQGCKKFRKVINVHTRHAKLHGKKQMVIKGWYIDSLVYHKMEAVPDERVTVTNCSGYSSIDLCA